MHSHRARRTPRSTGCARLLRNPARASRIVMRKMPVREKASRLAGDTRRQKHSHMTHGQRDVIARPRQPRLADCNTAVVRFTESPPDPAEPHAARAGNDAELARARPLAMLLGQ